MKARRCGGTPTAAICGWLIERVRGRVNLCESQGDQWITVRRDITPDRAEYYGFNLAAPAVRDVFAMDD